MNVIDAAKSWLFGIALKKAFVSAAKLLVSWCAAQGIKVICTINGIAIDTTNEAVMVLALNSGFTILRNFLKTKWPGYFGWM